MFRRVRVACQMQIAAFEPSTARRMGEIGGVCTAAKLCCLILSFCAWWISSVGMIDIPYYRVAAFARCAFAGNPAGVCLLEEWLPDVTLQNIAAENNFSATAFVVRRGSDYDVWWEIAALQPRSHPMGSVGAVIPFLAPSQRGPADNRFRFDQLA